ncbi:MAG: carboxylating nicotinate-nucleotide diphosphorylase [Verrucomicrobiota bacterium]
MSTPSFDPVAIAIEEDIGNGDITSEFFVPVMIQASAQIVAREKAVVAGTKIAAEVFRRIDPAIRIQIVRGDGATIASGKPIIVLNGPARSILKGERVALNFLQRLSGIATLTQKFVQAAGKSRVKILDTRKTTPGLRAFEKAAVVAGGGGNHRFGLFDMVLVKDNHIVARSGLSGLAAAIQRVHEARPGVRIEVEADRLDQVRGILAMADVDVILLDNMKPAEMRKAVALGKGKVKFEASGGITLKNVRLIAATGVDYISIGAITHSAPSVDLSLEIKNVAT